MKKQTAILLAALAAATLHAAAQGSLTPPPGAPAPVMKSLDQVEARTPLVAGQPGVAININGNINISLPGSYYLTGNVTINTAAAHGISIASSASPLTLDLNGYSLICTDVFGGNAITSSAVGPVTIRNGYIMGGTTVSGSTFTLNGWNNGVIATGPTILDSLHVRGIRVRGIDAQANSSRVQSCTVEIAGEMGIVAPTVLDSSARSCLSDAIWATSSLPGSYLVSNCTGESIGQTSASYGIDVNGGFFDTPVGVVMNSVGSVRNGTAIRAGTVMSSIGNATPGGIGIDARNVTNSSGNGSTHGILARNVTNSEGSGSVGIKCNTASYCRGNSTNPAGKAIEADIAIGCTKDQGTITSAQKHLGTP